MAHHAALQALEQPLGAACRFMAFDRHMNLVLGDAEEFRKLPPKKGLAEEDVSRRPPARCCLCFRLSCCFFFNHPAADLLFLPSYGGLCQVGRADGVRRA